MTMEYIDNACIWTMEQIDADGEVALALDPFYLINHKVRFGCAYMGWHGYKPPCYAV
jgi:hypothetical protein